MISDILSKPRGSKHKPLFGPQNIWTFWQHKFCNSATIMWYLLSGKHSRKTTAKPQKQLMTRFLARLKKQRLGKFLVRNMAFRALICHYVFVFPLSSDSSWTMSPTQHFHHHSPWDKGTQRIFTTFFPPNSCEINLHKIANRYSGTLSETVAATATVHRTIISAESQVEFGIPESQSPLDPGARTTTSHQCQTRLLLSLMSCSSYLWEKYVSRLL